MTDVTQPSAQEQTPPDLSQILSRFDAWMTAVEEAGYGQPSEMPEVARHLQTIADQTKRMTDTVMTLTPGSEALAVMARRMSHLEAQNTALMARMAQLHDQVDQLCDWLGEKPHPAAAQT